MRYMRDSSAVGRGWHRLGRSHDAHPALFTLVLATALSCWVYWSVVSNLRTVTSSDPDTPLFVWSLAHAPHRLLHWSNPFYSHAIFATTGGANLAFSATAPLLGILIWPVSLTAGPLAAFNFVMVLTPVLNTVAARRLLAVVTARASVSVTLGAFIIGFSPLILMHNPGRFQLSFQFVVLCALAEMCIARRAYAAGEPTSVRRLALIGALCGAQLWIGTELLAITLVVLWVVFVVAVLLRRDSVMAATRRRPVRADAVALIVALATMVIVAAPFLAALLLGSERYGGGYHLAARPLFGLRVANVFTPTESTQIRSPLPFSIERGALSPFYAEDTGYVSVFGLALVLLAVLSWRNRRRIQRIALASGMVCWVLALGPTIRWAGMNNGIPGPWRLIEYVPVLQEIVANRLSWGVFAAFGFAVAAGVSNDAPRQPRWRFAAERSLHWTCAGFVVLLFPAQFQQTRSVLSDAVSLVRQQCEGALVVTVPQEREQNVMELQARASFAFDLYRGFAFRASSGPAGPRLLIDDIAERGMGSDTAGTQAQDQMRQLGIGCVIAPATSMATIDRVASLLGPPIIRGEVAVWSRP